MITDTKPQFGKVTGSRSSFATSTKTWSDSTVTWSDPLVMWGGADTVSGEWPQIGESTDTRPQTGMVGNTRPQIG